MKWKYVFNSELKPLLWGHVDRIIPVVKDAGYKFFTWNGEVRSVDTGESIGIMVSELI